MQSLADQLHVGDVQEIVGRGDPKSADLRIAEIPQKSSLAQAVGLNRSTGSGGRHWLGRCFRAVRGATACYRQHPLEHRPVLPLRSRTSRRLAGHGSSHKGHLRGSFRNSFRGRPGRPSGRCWQ